ncbi:RagB/SusD family nutrient uptake outer membrane protein [Salmonirosea aquatica]|uniref:RagB/SusD family nutrient uptake outer membrane protein n=1 Tax=Salmonirosea aquatica TaxID=2654236 RepID=A0A7C9B9E5_9BACT|nr:RagB/SusD family nutrient uptake outer membrane protein [Cytophagaceae bacterium SJW1-29]
MKTYLKKYLVPVILVATTFSCTGSFLKENPVSVLNPASFYTSEAGLTQGVNAVYASLRSVYGENQGPLFLALMGTDEFLTGKNVAGAHIVKYDATFNSSMGETAFVWQSLYKTINTANVVLASEENVSMNQEAKNQLLAEVRFIRAHAYFYLVQYFGEISLLTEPTIGLQTDYERNTREDVYGQILEDLTFAEANLPSTTNDFGRVTKGAARHQLAKIHLVLKNWTAAADYAKKVIESGVYELQDDYVSIFEVDNQINSEIIWSIQYENDLLNSGAGNQSHTWFTNSYSDVQGMQRTLEWGRPFTRFSPTTHLMNLFEKDKDQRWHVWRRFEDYFYNNPASLPAGKKLGDPIDESWRGKPEFHWALKKFQDPSRLSPNETRGNKDFLVFRLGETYLIAAEALLMAGKPDEAAVYFNEIRRRAAKPGVDFLISSSALTLDLILDERSRELAGEVNRRADLVRTGKLLERVRKYGDPAVLTNLKEHHVLLPIPQNQIDLTTSVYSQNEGY